MLFTTTEAVRRVDPNGDHTETQAWFLRGRAKDVLPAAGRVGEGPKAEYLFDRDVVACAAVLWAVTRRTRIRDADDLRNIRCYLQSEFPGRGKSIIAAILEDIARGAEPVLTLALFYSRQRKEVCLVSHVQHPPGDLLAPPAADFECALQGNLDLLSVLSSFVERQS
jgi:hypothetical protein